MVVRMIQAFSCSEEAKAGRRSISLRKTVWQMSWASWVWLR